MRKTTKYHHGIVILLQLYATVFIFVGCYVLCHTFQERYMVIKYDTHLQSCVRERTKSYCPFYVRFPADRCLRDHVREYLSFNCAHHVEQTSGTYKLTFNVNGYLKIGCLQRISGYLFLYEVVPILRGIRIIGKIPQKYNSRSVPSVRTLSTSMYTHNIRSVNN